MIIVYKASFQNNKCYIGLTKNSLNQRMSEHKYRMRDKKYNYPFYNALRKYGFDSVTWDVVSSHNTMEEAEQQEIKLIAETRDYNYNIADGGNTIIYTDEIRRRISDGLKGKAKSEKCKQAISTTLKTLYEDDTFLTNMKLRIKDAMNTPNAKRNYIEGRTKIDIDAMKLKRASTIKKKQLDMYEVLRINYIKGMKLTDLSKITKISYNFIRLHKSEWMI